MRALPAIAAAFIVHFALRSRRTERSAFLSTTCGLLSSWLSQLTDGMTTERMATLCACEWTPERASRIIAVLRRRSPEPSAAEVLTGISPERRAAAEPNVQLALDFLRGQRALCAALEQQRALDKSPKAVDARLGTLWAALQPELPYARHAEEWARLGFQGHDPTTDLRGGGGLALCELLHLVAHRPTLCAVLVEAWSDPASPTRRTQLRSLPLALTSIHATSWLKALLEDGLLERSLLAHGAPRGYTELLPRYRDLFVELFEGFVAEWCASAWTSLHASAHPMHTSAHLPARRCTSAQLASPPHASTCPCRERRAPESVMQFEAVAAAFVARVRHALRRGKTLAETLAKATGEVTGHGVAPPAPPRRPIPALRWPCFYINLESRPDRRQRMERMLRGHGVATVRVDAVTKEAPPVRAVPEGLSTRPDRSPIDGPSPICSPSPSRSPGPHQVRAILEEFPAKRAGNVACSLCARPLPSPTARPTHAHTKLTRPRLPHGRRTAHFEAWRRVLALPAGQHAALVLEDDVRFLRGWRLLLEAHVRQMEQAHPGEPAEAWDVFYLDCAHGSGWDFGVRGLQSASNVVRSRRARPCATAACRNRAHARAPRRQMYTDAYMITKEAARAALAMVEEDESLDVEGVLLALQDRGRCFTTLPKLALQRWDDSDIQTGGRVRGLAQWYATSYHATFKEALYHDWDV